MMTPNSEARRLAKALAARQLKVVFAESCTGGLMAATLARVAGISDHFCGSAVTYRNDTKHRWLGISGKLLKRPGPVSREVAEAMAEGVLRATPEANWAASITGHLGPHAPQRFDGVIFIGIAQRINRRAIDTHAAKHMLTSTTRSERQREATQLALAQLRTAIETDSADDEERPR